MEEKACNFIPPNPPKFKVGDLVQVGQPDDVVGEYHNQLGKIEKLSKGRPRYYKDVHYVDENGDDYWRREPIYTGPAYWVCIVYFEDKSLDQKFLPFKEGDLKRLELVAV